MEYFKWPFLGGKISYTLHRLKRTGQKNQVKAVGAFLRDFLRNLVERLVLGKYPEPNLHTTFPL